MKTYRSIAAMALAVTMLASSVMPAAAAVEPVQVDNDLHITDEDWVQEAGGYQGETSVTFEVMDEGGGGEEDPDIFSAYVPTALPILMDLDGNVVAPTNAKVINGVENRAIQVEGMEATATGSMELVSMEEAAEAAPEEKVFGFSLAGEDMTGDMASLPIRIEAAGELDLAMQAEIPAQSEVHTEAEIATVLFTLDWADPDPLHLTKEEAEAIGFEFSEDGYGGMFINRFENKQARSEIVIPDTIDGVRVVQVGGFRNSSIEEVTIPSSVYTIAYGAFENCTSLKTVTINSNEVQAIGGSFAPHSVFTGCTSLAEININTPKSNFARADYAPWGAPSASVNWNNS